MYLVSKIRYNHDCNVRENANVEIGCAFRLRFHKFLLSHHAWCIICGLSNAHRIKFLGGRSDKSEIAQNMITAVLKAVTLCFKVTKLLKLLELAANTRETRRLCARDMSAYADLGILKGQCIEDTTCYESAEKFGVRSEWSFVGFILKTYLWLNTTCRPNFLSLWFFASDVIIKLLIIIIK